MRILLLCAVLLTGCATTPEEPVVLPANQVAPKDLPPDDIYRGKGYYYHPQGLVFCVNQKDCHWAPPEALIEGLKRMQIKSGNYRFSI